MQLPSYTMGGFLEPVVYIGRANSEFIVCVLYAIFAYSGDKLDPLENSIMAYFNFHKNK